jgi:long-chain acyl-CoA synthetase
MIDLRECPNLTTLFFGQAEVQGTKPFLWSKHEGRYQAITWQETAERVMRLARGLRSLGLEPGERVVLVAENRPEWLIADLAIMTAGGITVPAYTTNTTDNHRHILEDSGAVGAIVSTKALAKRLLPAASLAPECKWAIGIDPIEASAEDGFEAHQWSAVLEAGAPRDDDLRALAAKAGRDDIACLIYTSGTGGTPRGVMLSHGAILCNCRGTSELLIAYGLGDEIFLSFLPLSHAYEHTAGQFLPISLAAQIYYAESVEQLLANLAECRPTLMTAVPRLYESIHHKMLQGVKRQSAFKAKLFHRTIELGAKRLREQVPLSVGERLTDFLLERLVRKKVRQRFGGRLKAMISGGAALSPEVGYTLTALGLPILQGYGQTEAAPVITANPPGRVKLETVGPPLEGVEVKIADDGEILARGELVMKGYWRDPEGTAQVLVDGWLHTGDVGELGEDGYLKITDRKKDIIVLSGGDNISPTRVEGYLTLCPDISQAMVYGDRRAHLVAILVPSSECLDRWAKQNGKKAGLAELSRQADFSKALSAVVDGVNRELSALERVRRFMIAEEPFTVENGLLTPTMKVRRHKVCELYSAGLEALYGKSAAAGVSGAGAEEPGSSARQAPGG